MNKRLPVVCLLLLLTSVVTGACSNETASADGQATSAKPETELVAEAAMSSGFASLYGAYAQAARALSEDDVASAAMAVTYLETAARELQEKLDAETAGVAEEALEEIAAAVGEVAAASGRLQLVTDLAEMRDGFKQLSDAMIQYRDHLLGAAPKVAYCPMVDAEWLQSDAEIANPYYGSEMLRCGEIVRQ
jgi:hypothetical protein